MITDLDAPEHSICSAALQQRNKDLMAATKRAEKAETERDWLRKEINRSLECVNAAMARDALLAAKDILERAKYGLPKEPSLSVNEEQCKTVFLVTVMKPVDWDGVPDKQMRRDRTWGWYSTFEAAERAVLANATDMFECNYYNHAVIEEMPEGILALAKVRGWYFANYAETDDRTEPVVSKIDAPEWAKQIVNWGIG